MKNAVTRILLSLFAVAGPAISSLADLTPPPSANRWVQVTYATKYNFLGFYKPGAGCDGTPSWKYNGPPPFSPPFALALCIASHNTGQNASNTYMFAYSDVFAWYEQTPPNRNDPESGFYFWKGIADWTDPDYELMEWKMVDGFYEEQSVPDITVGDPIQVVDGSVVHHESAIHIPCPGIDLRLEHAYNSSLRYTGELGANWQHNFAWRLFRTNATFYVDLGTQTVAAGTYNIAQLVAGNAQRYDLRRADTNQQWSGLGPDGVRWYGEGELTNIFRIRATGGPDYHFDSEGYLTSISNTWGQFISLTYTNISGSNFLGRAQHNNGQSLEFQYQDSRLWRVNTPTNSLYVMYAYNGSGELTNITRTAGGEVTSSSFEYAVSGPTLLSRRRSADGRVADYTYTLDGAVYRGSSSVVETNYFGATLAYQPSNQRTLVTLNRGDTNLLYRYEYDPHTFQVTQIVKPDTNQVSSIVSDPWFFDPTSRRVDNFANGKWFETRYAYNTQRHPVSRAFGYGVIATNAWNYTWDDANNTLIQVVDPEGHVADFVYTNQSLSKVTTIYPDGTTPASSYFTYTSNGQLSVITNANGHSVQYFYDSYGFPTSVVPQLGPTASLQFNPLGHLMQLSLPGDSGQRITQFNTDGLGRITNVVYPNMLTESFAYDKMGLLTNRIDTAGRHTRFTFGPLQRLSGMARVGPTATNAITWVRDQQLNTLQVTDAAGRPVEHYTLDPLDRIVVVTNLEGQEMLVDYAVADYVNSVVRFDGTTVTNTYDAEGMLSRVVFPDATNTFTYFRNGLLKTAGNSLSVITNAYNAANWLTNSMGAGVGGAVSYAYWPGGQPSNVSSVAGSSRYSYDAAERLSSVEHPTATFNYAYNPSNGRMSSMQVSDMGLEANYGYDVLDRVTNITWRVGTNSALRSFGYAYDNAGMITGVAREDGSTHSYTYDFLDRLTGETRISEGMTNAATYAYDSAGNRTTKVIAGVEVAYTLPTDNNRLSSWSASGNLSGVASLAVRGHSSETIGTHPWLGQLYVSNAVAVVAPSVAGTNFSVAAMPLALGENVIVAAIGDVAGNVGYASATVTVSVVTNAAYAYDAAVCLTNVSYHAAGVETRTAFAWNSRYEMTSVHTNGTIAETYQYDAFGRRVTISDGSITNWLVYDGIHVIAETTSNGTLTKSYAYGPGIDNALAMTTYGSTTNTYYYLTDHLGTVHALANTNDVIVESYKYDAWGRVLGVYDANGTPLTESVVGNRILWQGREYSWKTGLYYFRARWYDPLTGRWLSNDPIGISGGLNQYVFCANNPVNHRDPRGKCTTTPTSVPSIMSTRTTFNTVLGAETYAESMRGAGGNDSDHHAIFVREIGNGINASFGPYLGPPLGAAGAIGASGIATIAEIFAPSSDWFEDIAANAEGMIMYFEGSQFPYEDPNRRP